MSASSFVRILNIGNTHIQVFDSAAADSFVCLDTFPTARFHELPDELFAGPAAAACVAPALSTQLQKRGVFLVSPSGALPFAPSDLEMSTVGADRIANAAALLAGPLPALAVDCGTAITFEYVTARRQFAGGAILPGRMLLRRALHHYTARLPLIPLTGDPPELPGKNTAAAIRIGTDRGLFGAVGSLIRDWRTLCAPLPLRVVACGGDRFFFLKYLHGMEDGGEFFTARGIRGLWEAAHAR